MRNFILGAVTVLLLAATQDAAFKFLVVEKMRVRGFLSAEEVNVATTLLVRDEKSGAQTFIAPDGLLLQDGDGTQFMLSILNGRLVLAYKGKDGPQTNLESWGN